MAKRKKRSKQGGRVTPKGTRPGFAGVAGTQVGPAGNSTSGCCSSCG